MEMERQPTLFINLKAKPGIPFVGAYRLIKDRRSKFTVHTVIDNSQYWAILIPHPNIWDKMQLRVDKTDSYISSIFLIHGISEISEELKNKVKALEELKKELEPELKDKIAKLQATIEEQDSQIKELKDERGEVRRRRKEEEPRQKLDWLPPKSDKW